MEFGRTGDIGRVDFSLPPDDALTERLWASLPRRKEQLPHLHVGCAVWGRKDWIGKVYPKGAKEKDFLSYYVTQFNCIELNTLFYGGVPEPCV